MKRVLTFRLDPTNKKVEFLTEIGNEMKDLANYVVDTYLYNFEIKKKGDVKKSVFYTNFIKNGSKYNLIEQSTIIKKTRYYEGIITKIIPNVKNYIDGMTEKPVYRNNFLYFQTRLVEFVQTKNGSWGIDIVHPNKRGEKIFIRLANNKNNEDKIKKVVESGTETTFVCEILHTYNGKWILSAVHDIGESPNKPDKLKHIIGVDRGILYPAVAVATDMEGNVKGVKFFSCKGIYEQRKNLKHRMSELQAGKHWKAYNRIKRLDGNLIKQINHSISKELVEWTLQFESPIICFENLKGAKKDLQERNKELCNKYKLKYKNWILSFWSPAMLRELVEYKAEEVGIKIIDVNPKNTSRRCPKCEYTDKNNRSKTERKFVCLKCGYQNNDDLVGAMNIASKGIYKLNK